MTMDKDDFDAIALDDACKCAEALKRFVQQVHVRMELYVSKMIIDCSNRPSFYSLQKANSFDFTTLHQTDQWEPLWNGVFQLLNTQSQSCDADNYPDCLTLLHQLSRVKSDLNKDVKNEQIDCLLNIANIGKHNVETTVCVSLKAMKVLFNLIYLSARGRNQYLKNSVVEGVVQRLRDFRWVSY